MCPLLLLSSSTRPCPVLSSLSTASDIDERAKRVNSMCVFPSSRNLYDVLVGPSIGRRRHPITGAISCQTERNRTPIKHDVLEWTAYGPQSGGGTGNWCAFALSLGRAFLKCALRDCESGLWMRRIQLSLSFKNNFQETMTCFLLFFLLLNLNNWFVNSSVTEWSPIPLLITKCFSIVWERKDTINYDDDGLYYWILKKLWMSSLLIKIENHLYKCINFNHCSEANIPHYFYFLKQ